MITINEYLDNILNDFQEYLATTPKLCGLKSVHFDAGKIPDYCDIHVQQLYLLRYAYGYAFEYKCMYESLFNKYTFSDETVKVVSVGCGTGIDYWSMISALKDVGLDDKMVKYKGIDIIDWKDKFPQRKNDFMKIYQGEAVNIFTNAKSLSSDIYVFPKSISELDSESIDKMCNAIQNQQIKKDTFYLLASLRDDEFSLERDIEKTNKLFNAFINNGFKSENDPHNSIVFKDDYKKKKIREIDDDFKHPSGVVACLKDLNEYCINFNGFVNCENDCEQRLGRWPMLSCDKMRWQIFKFERR